MSQPAIVPVRHRQRRQPSSLRLLTFQLRHHWFCLPLVAARRVLAMPPAIAGRTADWVHVQNQAIPLVDAAQLVYGPTAPAVSQLMPAVGSAAPTPLDAEKSTRQPGLPAVQSIIVVDLPDQQSMGLIVEGTPVLKRVSPAAFSPVPPLYLTVHRLRGVTSLVKLEPNGDADVMLLLAVDQLALLGAQ